MRTPEGVIRAASAAVGLVARLPKPTTRDIELTRDLKMVASDGAVLLADRWAPRGVPAAELPLVLNRTPYGRRATAFVSRWFAERGYQMVVQSCRGTFGSGGEWNPFRNERADGLDCLRWLEQQPWFPGTVYTFGASYMGFTQWAVADVLPDFVKGMALDVTAADFRNAVTFPGGSFALETGANWVYLTEHQEEPLRQRLAGMRAVGKGALDPAYTSLPLSAADSAVVDHPVGYYQDWLEHWRLGDQWWDPVNFSAARVKAPPTTMVGGWYDLFLPEQVTDYEAMVEAGREVRITIGPWTHQSPGGAFAQVRDGLDFFDRLGGRSRGVAKPVTLYVMGRKKWVRLDAWPPPATAGRWYLGPGLSLSRSLPEDQGSLAYHYDASDPTPGIGAPSLSPTNAGPKDQKDREARADVLCFTSQPFKQATTIAGNLAAEVYVRGSHHRFDLHVRLCLVDLKGKSTNISDGIIRLLVDQDGTVCSGGSEAWGSAQVVGEATGEDAVIRASIRMWPTALEVQPGESIRLQVASGAHPLFTRNPGSAAPLGEAEDIHPVDVAVLWGPEWPSGIDLPIARL